MELSLTGFSASTILWTSLALLLALAAHVWLQWWTRRRARQEDAAADAGPPSAAAGRHRFAQALRDVAPPLALLIWIHGAYMAVDMLLGDVRILSGPAALALDRGYGLATLGALVWLLSRIGRQLEGLLVSLAAGAETIWDEVMLPLAGLAVRRLLPLVALVLGAPALTVSPAFEAIFRSATSLLLIAVVAYVLLQMVDALATVVLGRHRLDARDNLQARAVHTQVMVLKKVAVTVIAIFTVASMLMVFESVRQFGASILASAGIAGIVVGFAAQRSIGALLAGFQIALTQPIRVDDVVIVENEWGRIDDITLTYVVIRIWDERRLIVPITYFIEQPFQNWTRTSADLLGTVFLHVDYTVPVDALRAELTRILEASPFWDGRVNGLVVTDATEHTLQVRALASAADASLAWDLRCEIREKLIAFLQRHHPESLPRLRASIAGTMTAAAGDQ